MFKPLTALLICFLALGVYPVHAQEEDVHDALFEKDPYPSANTCKTCHPTHFKEWSVSQHAYAQVSPVFNALQGKINKLTNGTNGDFCIRCHTQVGMSLKEKTFMPNADRHHVSREGVTCIVCHRRPKPYGKVSGRIAIRKGDLFDPIYGPNGNDELAHVIESGEYNINTDRTKEGRDIHFKSFKNAQMTTSAFCATCHDVNHIHGFRLEEAFSEYKSSPAARKNISCQDCHMGLEPGKPSGYAEGPAAIVGGKPTRSRKLTNHMFVGPDYSVVHPGIFPHNTAAQEIAVLKDWLKFDFLAGWGTDEFEDNLEGDEGFPQHWEDSSDRYDAREIIEENLALLDKAQSARETLLRNGYHLGDIVVTKATDKTIKFKVEVKNPTEGHNTPTGFDAERLVFLRIQVKDADGEIIFKSGDLDPNGDLRDSHSAYVHSGQLKLDQQLFNLQSKFLIRMIKGGEREEVLPVDYSGSPLPFLRPEKRATILLGHPSTTRKHRKTIRPLSSVWAKYKINKKDLQESSGPYTADIQLIANMAPVNLARAIADVGFDYGLSLNDVAQALVAGEIILWERTLELTPGTYASETP